MKTDDARNLGCVAVVLVTAIWAFAIVILVKTFLG